jgi:peptide/nickel transport system ATP-binding protein
MALACDAELIVLDEPTTGLDAATEVGIFDLLRELKVRRRLSLLFISHNLAAVGGMADRVAIMYGGRLMESGPTRTVFSDPRHRYTQLMLHALPRMQGLIDATIEMRWESSSIPEEGCPFRARCDVSVPQCAGKMSMTEAGHGQQSACVRWASLPPLGLKGDAEQPIARRRNSCNHDEGALVVSKLTHRYMHGFRARNTRAERLSLDHVGFTARRNEVLAIIGESGSGKTTLARCLVGLLRPLSGSIGMQGVDLAKVRRYPLHITRNLQIVFQNIAGSLHPRKRLDTILTRPYQLYERRSPSRRELEELVDSVGLRSDALAKQSTRLSGGERQRGALARAFATRPKVIVLDEAFSALDVSMKMKVRNLLLTKKAEIDATYLLITHDLPLARVMADRVLVLYRGWVCETGPVGLFEGPPYHPYTETLLWSALQLEGRMPRRLRIRTIGSNSAETSVVGCRFHTRCPRKLGAICEREHPPRQEMALGHWIECHVPAAQLREMQRPEWEAQRVVENVQ